MKPKFQFLLLLCIICLTANAQKDTLAISDIGATAPPLRVKKWIKGTPVQSFEKGKVYVVEFWATWCRPCIAAMPHLSDLARKYKREATFLAIDIHESHAAKNFNIEQVKAFVKGMGRRMDFNIAAEDTNFTTHDWIDAFDKQANGIPITFVVDRQGKVAWAGHPHYLDTVLQKILNNTWNIKEVLSKEKFNYQWEKSDSEVLEKIQPYLWNGYHLEDLGKPDSILFVINQMIRSKPNLKYAPRIASFTFFALLLIDKQKAYEYGKEAMATPTYEEPPYDMFIGDIKSCSLRVNMTKDIYRLGAQCYQAEIDGYFYPELVDIAKKYREMAEWYRLAGDKSKALEADKKAIKYASK